jgi:hypothetical protein
MKEKVLYVALGVVVGIVLGPQISKLPLVSKIPTV